MRIVVTGGGTGGHIMPAIAVAEALRRACPDADLLYIGSTSGMETGIVPNRGIAYQGVTARKLTRVASLNTVAVMLSLAQGYREASTYLKAFRTQAVVGTGGYVAAATVLAAARLGIPTLIVEGNAVPGRTNRLLAGYARRICISFNETLEHFPREKTSVTGLPLRAGVIAPENIGRQDARCRFENLSAERFTILVVGGSQGAARLNEVVLDAAPALIAEGAQLLHQTGKRNYDAINERTRDLQHRAGYVPAAFLDDDQMPLALRAADLVICRGGISTLSEVLANGLPSIVVPLSTAYADHQTANAAALVREGAAVLMPEIGLTGDALRAEVTNLRNDESRRTAMSDKALELGRPNAADAVAKLVTDLIPM